MKNAELIALLIANTNKTRNLRTYGNKWFSGARRICDRIATKVGQMIALIQDKIDQGEIINGRYESLLLYNFQPLFSDKGAVYITLDMLIKPIEKIHDTHDLSGTPIQLVVDGNSGEVMNNARAMLKLGMMDDIQEIQNPKYYGNYSEYRAVASFMPIRNHVYLKADDIFAGKLDRSECIQSSVALDSFVEAREYLDKEWDEYCMIAELNYPKEEHSAMKADGIGKHIIKLAHPYKPEVKVSDKLSTEPKEDRVDDEVRCLLEAAKEAPSEPDFGIR